MSFVCLHIFLVLLKPVGRILLIQMSSQIALKKRACRDIQGLDKNICEKAFGKVLPLKSSTITRKYGHKLSSRSIVKLTLDFLLKYHATNDIQDVI